MTLVPQIRERTCVIHLRNHLQILERASKNKSAEERSTHPPSFFLALSLRGFFGFLTEQFFELRIKRRSCCASAVTLKCSEAQAPNTVNAAIWRIAALRSLMVSTPNGKRGSMLSISRAGVLNPKSFLILRSSETMRRL